MIRITIIEYEQCGKSDMWYVTTYKCPTYLNQWTVFFFARTNDLLWQWVAMRCTVQFRCYWPCLPQLELSTRRESEFLCWQLTVQYSLDVIDYLCLSWKYWCNTYQVPRVDSSLQNTILMLLATFTSAGNIGATHIILHMLRVDCKIWPRYYGLVQA